MEFSYYISVIFVIIESVHAALVHTANGDQVCMLKRRPDPSRDGKLRWSLPYSELCFCQAVVAPNYQPTCSTIEADYGDDELWFVDDHSLLTKRQNWNEEALDELLERREYCANECALETDTCDINAVCTDVPGSFECTCSQGFSGDGFTCDDDDECVLPSHNCRDANAVCVNIPGSYHCSCNTGYSDNGETCTDDDECVSPSDNCDANAVCTNTPGSFSCSCNAGYNGDGETCTDDDECALPRHNCDANAVCTNTPGSFSCDCNAGYNGDGETCTDNDECDLLSHKCDDNAVCTNITGSYNCSCNRTGYSGDGKTCTDTESPVISATSDIETNVCSATTNVSWMYAASDNSGEVTLTSDIASGSEFPIGTTNVTLTAVDPSGNVAMASFMVIVTVISGTSVPLGLEDGSVADDQLTASSFWSENLRPGAGRLNGAKNWATAAGSLDGAWIQVDFLTPVVVTAIQTQGAATQNAQWVTKYNLQFGTEALMYYKSPTDIVEFTGNTDQSTVVENAINPIFTRYVRILIVERKDGIALRMEVVGYRCS